MWLDNYISNMYLNAFILFFVVFLVFRVGFFVLEKILLKLTLKTKTDLDDIMLARSSKPINIILFLVSLRIVFSQIETNLNPGLTMFIDRVIYTIITISVGYLIYVIIDLVIGRAFKRFAKRTKSKFDDNLFALVHSVLKMTVIVVVLLYVLGIWGIEVLPLLGALGVAGIAVALALQPVLGNIFSGASIILDKSVGVGDLVYLDSQTKGKVLKVGIRSTKILTFDNELIIVPNTKLAESVIQNVALPEPMSRVVVPFSVAYGSDIEKVKKIVMEQIKSVKDLFVDEDHEPKVRFLEMGESSLNFKAYFYVENYEDRFNAIDEINTKIYNALNKNGIEIPFPQLDVHLKE